MTLLTANLSHAVEVPTMTRPDPTDWNSVAAAFEDAPALAMRQAWREEAETDLRVGTVRLGRSGDRLLVYAVLVDDEVATRATERNQPLYELGDVFEIFAGIAGQPGYIEYHIAPNDVILQLRWPDSAAVQRVKTSADLQDFAVMDNSAILKSRRTAAGWEVYVEIPLTSLPGGEESHGATPWQVNFSRYDYTADFTRHVLAATAPLTRPAFHRRDEWTHLRFGK